VREKLKLEVNSLGKIQVGNLGNYVGRKENSKKDKISEKESVEDNISGRLVIE
jgi:hypothetical protein